MPSSTVVHSGCEKYTTCQGASNDYDWKMRTKKGAVYQR